MEENQNLGEQPQSIETLLDNQAGSPNEECEKPTESEAERGVPVGKFNSVEDLLEAYNNLQSEFTRKCQKLSALEKEKTTQTTDNEFAQFLSKNANATAYAEEIKARAEKYGSGEKEGYSRAWADILYEKLTSPNKASEPIVQNLILQDNQLKNLIIENYVKQLQSTKTPVVMSSGSGEKVTQVATSKPDTFEDAKNIVLKLLS